ncbi:MAG: hypothetical protein OEV31_06970 [Gammaproteobacteria bacterium]|nr:hypothetical protein [Gammaproteobacteria bacterium]
MNTNIRRKDVGAGSSTEEISVRVDLRLGAFAENTLYRQFHGPT